MTGRSSFDFMAKIFGETGWFGSMPGYRVRPGQIEMAAAVYETIDAGGSLLVEGPTGTGKSKAYLVPAIIAAHYRGARTVVATANTNLQAQLAKKDLPELQRTAQGLTRRHTLDAHSTFVSLKGVNNYFCEVEAATAEDASAFLNAEEQSQLRGLIQLRRKGDWDGDKAELDEEPSPKVWGLLSTDSFACQGNACDKASVCPAMQLRMQARTTDICVVNYHLLFSDMLSDGQILGRIDTLICDEAHNMADIARDFFGALVSVGTIGRAMRRFSKPADKKLMMTTVKEFFDDVADTYFPNSEGTRKINAPLSVDPERLLNVLRSLYVYYRDKAQRLEGNLGGAAQAKKDMEYVTSMANQVIELCYRAEGADGVTFVRLDGNNCSIQNRQADVSGILSRLFYERNIYARILTSATLSDGESFSFVKEELGLTDARECIVKSPFNLSEQMAVMVGHDLPAPAGETKWSHLEAAAHAIFNLIIKNRGRCLVLFTSKQALEFTQNVVARRFSESDGPQYTIYIQGTLTKNELIRRFKEETSSCLFGLASFWEGIDVPGESLSCLIIHKLPFPSPDDPVIQALEKRHGFDGFNRVSVPRAAIALRQGYGRLIRSVTDLGIVVFLDPRVVTRQYGTFLLRELKDVPLYPLDRFDDVVRAFDEKRALIETNDALKYSSVKELK